MSANQLIGHTLVIVALIVAYTVLTITGHDGNALLGAMGGYIGGAGTQAVATRKVADAVPAGPTDTQATP